MWQCEASALAVDVAVTVAVANGCHARYVECATTTFYPGRVGTCNRPTIASYPSSLSLTPSTLPLPFSHDGYFVDLFVRKSNNVAISMYEKFGYSIYRRVLGYYSGTEDAYGTSSAAVVSVGEGHGKREGEGGLLCLNGDTLLQ